MRHVTHSPVRGSFDRLSCALLIAFVSAFSSACTAEDDRGAFHAEYIVQVKDTAAHLLHVTATFSNLRQPYLEIALPVWTPGYYWAENYYQDVRRFTVRDGSSARLRAPKVQPSIWRIETRGANEVTAEFDYVATNPGSIRAGITSQYAFFTGTQLFLEPVGHRQASSTVQFIVPPGWGVASALRETADPTVFTAIDYDELVDAPTVLGSFDSVRFEVEGKPHFVVTIPAGTLTVDSVPASVPQIIRTQRAIFGSLPYDKYVFFLLSSPNGEVATGAGALEHLNSSVYPDPGGFPNEWLVAHEFFHLWNVKRIRPTEIWPYDYSRVNPGPSLWVSEGITSYYASLTTYGGDTPAEGIGPDTRAFPVAGADDEGSLLEHFAYTISRIESNPERHHVSPTDASHSGAGGFAYSKGEVLGALLDLSILHDTQARRGLDDVMRALYAEHYERGRGFTPNDLVRIVSSTAGRDYTDFFDRYVTDVQTPPYDSIFAYAGYSVSRVSRNLGVLGTTARSISTSTAEGDPVEGRFVYRIPNETSPAALAGIRVGDVIVSVEGVPIHQVPLANLFGLNWIGGRFLGKAGERVVVRVLRDDSQQDIPVTLGTREEINFRIESDPVATSEQLAVRSAWLER